MSNAEEHFAEQEALTARYEELSPAAQKLHDDFDFHIDFIPEDADGKLMEIMGMDRYDEWRADRNEDALDDLYEVKAKLAAATELLKEIASLDRDDDGDIIIGADEHGNNDLMDRIELFMNQGELIPFYRVRLIETDDDGVEREADVFDCTVLCGRAGPNDYSDPVAILQHGSYEPIFFETARCVDIRTGWTISRDQIDWEASE